MNFKNIFLGIFLSFVFIFILGIIILGSQFLLNQNKSLALSNISVGAENLQPTVASKPTGPQRNWQVADLNILASSGISVESNLIGENKILFSKNSEIRLPIASLTKLVTAIVVLDNYDLSENITLSKEAEKMDAVQQDLKVGDTLPIGNFLYIMLIESSNKAAYQLSMKMGDQKFIDLMNQKVKSIGLQNTSFVEPTGLSDKNYSTAGDLVKLAEYILKNYPKIAEISRIQEFNFPQVGKITNTNQLLGCTPGIVCGKTGFTTDAKGCLFLIMNNPKANDYLIYIILGSDDRFSEMKNVISWVGSAYNW